MVEEWRDIAGYEGWYQVSNIGNVKSIKRRHNSHGHWCILHTEIILKPTLFGKGYQCVRLAPVNKNEKKRGFAVHRLVAEAFIPNPDNLPQIDHINRNKLDNRVENLRWVTNGENQENTTANVNLKAFGESKTITRWSREYGISTGAIKQRLDKGWDMEKILTIPPTDNKTRSIYFGERKDYGRRKSKG